MFTLDASVHLNAANLAEDGSADSQEFLAELFSRSWPIIVPTLLLVEVAAATARALDDADQAMALANALRDLPNHSWVPLDERVAAEAVRLAATCRVRGADAVYAAVARLYGTTLVTLDRQQLARLASVLPVLTPGDALARLRTLDFPP